MLTEEEIKQLEDDKAALEKEKEDWNKEKTGLETKVTEAETAKDKAETNLVSVKQSAGHFRKLSEMNDEEKAKLTEKEKDLLQREENLANEKVAYKDEISRQVGRENMIRRYVGDDQESRKALEDAYGTLTLPEGTPEETQARIDSAAKLAGIEKHEPNISVGFGEGVKPKKEGDSFADTEKGKEALKKMFPDTKEPENKEANEIKK